MSKIGFASKNIGYTPGSFYKRFHGTYAQRMNRQAVEAYREQVAALGSAMFNPAVEQSMGLSELAAQQAAKRVEAAAQSLTDNLDDLKSGDGTDSEDGTDIVV